MKWVYRFATALIVFALAGWFYFTPHLAVHGMKAAIDARDAQKLSNYVDFPSLKESLKLDLKGRIAHQMEGDKTDTGSRSIGKSLSLALASALISPVVDAVVTPQGLALLMQGERPDPKGDRRRKKGGQTETPAQPSSQSGSDPAKPDDSRQRIETSSSYESFDRFVVSVRRKEDAAEPVVLVLRRSDLIRWKLAEVRLPD